MICPNCGETVQTRHLFCVVCGADLMGIRPESAGARLKKALIKPIGGKKQKTKQPVQVKAAAADAARQSFADAPEQAVFPDFMRNYT